jgi:aminomethyltransferase
LGWTVDLKSDRNFTGKKALLETPVKKQLIGLVLIDRGVLRSHQRVEAVHAHNEGEGEITSGGFSPTLNKSIALARLPLNVSAGDEVQVVVREKALRAKIVKYPFVRNGKILVDMA